MSGIYSTQLADGKFGIALIGSYQVRDSGYNQAFSNNGWKSFAGIKDNDWSGSNAVYGGLPKTSNDIKNRPGVDSIYSVPQSFAYAFTGIHRERKNGQLVLQARPTQDMVATLDYVISEQKFRQTRNDLSAWFGSVPAVPAACKGNALLKDDGCARQGYNDFEKISFWRTPVSQCKSQKDGCVPYHKWVSDYIAILGGR